MLRLLHFLELYGVFVNVCLLGEITTERRLVTSDTKIGNEYYLNVNAYNFDNEESPIIKARLKLTALEDKGLLEGHDYLSSYAGKEWSRFLSVEVVSYEYSEIYMFIDELFEENDDE